MDSVEGEDLGCDSPDLSVDYPVYAAALASKIRENPERKGVLICGTGVGMSIGANRCSWIRAALCHNVKMSILARQHNDANVIVFGADFIDKQPALECLRAFIKAEFSSEEKHELRVSLLSAGLEEGKGK